MEIVKDQGEDKETCACCCYVTLHYRLQSGKLGNKIKGIHIEKVVVNLFALKMILYRDQPKNKKLLELMKKFSKIVGYKANIEKSAVFLYTNSWKMNLRNQFC